MSRISHKNASRPRERSVHMSVKYVAKPSLSQISDHSAQVKRSPNHWCAASCATSPVIGWSTRPFASNSAVSVKVVADRFSMPP